MKQVPHDLEAEESLLGAMMLSSQAIDAVADVLLAEDFYKPAHGVIYDAVLHMRGSGIPVDAVTVCDVLTQRGVADACGGAAAILALMSNTPGVIGSAHYAQIIMDRSLRRRMMAEGEQLASFAADMGVDAADTLESHQAILGTMGAATVTKEPDDVSVEEFMQRPKDSEGQWAVKHLLRRQHKLMVVAGEGAGKSVLLRFIAICSAYGVQPFRHERVKPIRTLIVDLENPEDAMSDSFEMILRQVTKVSPQAETVNRLWWKPAGINLRNRADLAALENVIETRRPDLVCLGPLYAAYSNGPNDMWETAAREVQSALKKLMVRYNFGLMIEDHAPQGDSGGKRIMRPYGSSFWLRWPDIGIGLVPAKDGSNALNVEYWRGNRVKVDWPTRLARGEDVHSQWPFVAYWD